MAPCAQNSYHVIWLRNRNPALNLLCLKLVPRLRNYLGSSSLGCCPHTWSGLRRCLLGEIGHSLASSMVRQAVSSGSECWWQIEGLLLERRYCFGRDRLQRVRAVPGEDVLGTARIFRREAWAHMIFDTRVVPVWLWKSRSSFG
eukprot:2530913-Amphidinium_carterae.1